MAGGYLPRTFSCVCGSTHALVDDNDVWTDEPDGLGRIIGRTACLIASGRLQCEARNRDAGGRCQRPATLAVDKIVLCEVHRNWRPA